jgi:hypothetical protein
MVLIGMENVRIFGIRKNKEAHRMRAGFMVL